MTYTESGMPYLFAQFNTAADFWNVFLENGAYFYLDTGNHPEYATPECSSPKDMVIYHKADEPLLWIPFDALATLDLEVDRIAVHEFLRVYQS